MKSEKEIKHVITKILHKHFLCKNCKVIDPEIDYDGDMRCGKCKNLLNGSWKEYGALLALKWVLGEMNDNEFYEEMWLHS